MVNPEPTSPTTTEQQTSDIVFDRQRSLKLAVELGPLIVFFLVNWLSGKYLADPKQAIFWATGVFMVATVAAIVVSHFAFHKVAAMPLVTAVVVVIFGGLTLYLQNDQFIKMKPTIVNSIFAIVLLAGLATNRIFLKMVLGDVMKLTLPGWRLLTIRWAIFFAFLAVLNEFVWRMYSTDTWVTFKVFGIMPLTTLFALSQIGLMKKYEEA